MYTGYDYFNKKIKHYSVGTERLCLYVFMSLFNQFTS